MTQGKGTTAGDLSSSLKKTEVPAAKKKAVGAAEPADLGDVDGLMSGTAKSKPALGGAPRGGGGPKIYTCYMCGQGFSGSSLGIHQPKCQQKWLAEQAAKPAGKLLMSHIASSFLIQEQKVTLQVCVARCQSFNYYHVGFCYPGWC